jgi:hypothetical protein
MFRALKRVEVSWPQDGKKFAWPELASEIRNAKQALCVVNLKRHALDLLDKLSGIDGLFHLSTNMCAEHRREVLKKVHIRLSAGETCRLVSTQCIEAGVDLDFPLVYRALAPLEAIAQAAGRCNREGRLSGMGKAVVFEPDEEGNWRSRYPTHAYFQATEVTRSLLAQHGTLDINDPRLFQDYYRRLYDLNNPSSQNKALTESITAGDFQEVARQYRLIEQNTIQVLVPWHGQRNRFDALRVEAEREGISARWMRDAQSLAVGIYRTKEGPPPWAIPAKFRRGGISDEWFILEGNYYDDTIGLNPPNGDQVFIA